MKKARKFLHWRKLGLALIVAFGLYAYCRPPSEHEIRASVVRITSDKGLCSGEQIEGPSGQVYILTASHCRPLINSDGAYLVTTEDGRQLERREIQEDPYSDILLIEGIPGLPALKIADLAPIKEMHVRTFTHGARMDTYKTEGELIQKAHVEAPIAEIVSDQGLDYCKSMPKYKVVAIEDWSNENHVLCVLSVDETATTAKIVPGSSGGPAVDDSGRLIGVVSAGDGVFGYLVNLEDIRAFLKSY